MLRSTMPNFGKDLTLFSSVGIFIQFDTRTHRTWNYDRVDIVTFDCQRFCFYDVEDIKKGMIEYRADSYGIVHSPVGKVSFDAKALEENINYLVNTIEISFTTSFLRFKFFSLAIIKTPFIIWKNFPTGKALELYSF